MDEQFAINKALALCVLKELESILEKCIQKLSEGMEKFDKERDPALLTDLMDCKIQAGLAYNNFEGALTICVIADFYNADDAMEKLRKYKDTLLETVRGF